MFRPPKATVVAIDARQWKPRTLGSADPRRQAAGARRRRARPGGTSPGRGGRVTRSREIRLTSHHRDGTRDGYDLELTRAVSEAARIPVIASGGAGNLHHLYEGLTAGAADAVLAAFIFHYQEYASGRPKSTRLREGCPFSGESSAGNNRSRADKSRL